MTDRPQIIITSGDPAGIGFEVTLKALQQSFDARIAILGDPNWAQQVAHTLKLPVTIHLIDDINECPRHRAGHATILHHELYAPAKLGVLDQRNAPYVIDLLTEAHTLAYTNKVDAIVTAPVHKGVINDANIPFTGHTEFFAEKSADSQVVMMLASESLNVALATTHLPLKDVANALTAKKLLSVIEVSVHALRQLGFEKPRIKILGLNPHAGEQGHLGSEEIDTIIPVIQQCQSLPAEILGPYPADTVFSQQNLASTDMFLAMYHDQGLPVIKYSSFGKCANVTLGLPYLRTSVDHGTALEIADKGIASESSMVFAIDYAIKQSKKKHDG